MIFDAVSEGGNRAALVAAALDPSLGWVRQGFRVVLTGERAFLDAGKGVVWWREADGKQRHLILPSEISLEALAGLLRGLGEALLPAPVRA